MLTLLLCLCGEQCVARRVLLGRRAAGLSAILSTRLAPSCPLARKLSLFPLKALSPLCLSVSPRASWASWGAEAGAEAAPLPKVFGSDGLVERLRTTGRVGADDDLARAYERRPADLSGVQVREIEGTGGGRMEERVRVSDAEARVKKGAQNWREPGRGGRGGVERRWARLMTSEECEPRARWCIAASSNDRVQRVLVA